MARLRTTVAGLTLNGLGAVIGQIGDLVTLAVLSRTIDTRETAAYLLLLQVIRVVYIMESGMGQDLTRSLASTAEDDEDAAISLRSGTTWYVYLFFLAALLMILAAAVVRSIGSGISGSFVVFIGLSTAIRVLTDGVFRAHLGLMNLVFIRVMSLLRTAGTLAVVLTLASRSSLSFALGFAAVEVLVLVLALIPLRKRLRRSRSSVRYSRREMIDRVLPMAKANITGFVSNRLDGFIVGLLLGSTGVIIHGLLLRIYDLMRGALEFLLNGVVQATSVAKRNSDWKTLGTVTFFATCLVNTAATVMATGLVVLRDQVRLIFPEGVTVPTYYFVLIAFALSTVGVSVALVYVATGMNIISGLLPGVYISSAVNFVTTVAATFSFGASGPFVGVFGGGIAAGVSYVILLSRRDLRSAVPWPRLLKYVVIIQAVFVATLSLSLSSGHALMQVLAMALVLSASTVLLLRLPARLFLKAIHRTYS